MGREVAPLLPVDGRKKSAQPIGVDGYALHRPMGSVCQFFLLFLSSSNPLAVIGSPHFGPHTCTQTTKV